MSLSLQFALVNKTAQCFKVLYLISVVCTAVIEVSNCLVGVQGCSYIDSTSMNPELFENCARTAIPSYSAISHITPSQVAVKF